MIAFAGNTFLGYDLVATKFLRFWAERGMIHVEDSRDSSYKVFSVRDCLLRMRALQEMLGNSTQRQMYSEDQFDKEKRAEIQTMVEGMLKLCEIAKEQGMPSDASARRDLVRRRPKSVVVPGNHSM